MSYLPKQMKTFYTNFIKQALTVGILILVLFIYLFNLQAIGPEYDELLSVNGALNCPSNVFLERVVWIKEQCIPIMLSPYIGGITSSIYRLGFFFLSASVLSFRFINIILVLSSLALLYLTVRNYYNYKIAAYTTVLLSIDFQLWRNVRFESTTSVPLFLKSIFLFLLVSAVKTKKWYFWPIAGFTLGLSIWAKFDAVFFYLSLFIAHIVLNFKSIKSSKEYLRQQINSLFLLLLGLLIGLFPFLFYLSSNLSRFLQVSSSIGKGNIVALLVKKISLLLYQFSSFDAIWYVFREKIDASLILTLLTLVFWAVFILSLITMWKNKQTRIIILTLLFFYTFFVLYGGLISSHHRVIVYPLPQIVLAFWLHKQRIVYQAAFAVLFVFILSYSYIQMFSLSQKVGSIGAYSDRIYPLADYLNTLDNKKILIGDWGIATQLVLLANNPKNIEEIAFAANRSERTLIDSAVVKKIESCEYIVLHTPQNAIFVYADTHLRSIIRGSRVYTDSVFEVYQCE